MRMSYLIINKNREIGLFYPNPKTYFRIKKEYGNCSSRNARRLKLDSNSLLLGILIVMLSIGPIKPLLSSAFAEIV